MEKTELPKWEEYVRYITNCSTGENYDVKYITKSSAEAREKERINQEIQFLILINSICNEKEPSDKILERVSKLEKELINNETN